MDLKEVFEKRRSVNFFDRQAEISFEEIERIYQLAKLAPSSFNLQPWKLIIVRTSEGKKRLREVALNQAKVEEASVILVFLGDKEAYKDLDKVFADMVKKGYRQEGEKKIYQEVVNSLYGNPFAERGFALRNTGLFAMSFMLSARYYGYDTHPMDGFDQEGVKKVLDIPPRYEVVMLLALGRRDESKPLLGRLERKSFREVVLKEV